jgi:hypothetical protein
VTTLTRLKLAVGLVALLVWVQGVRVDDARLRWLGIGLLLVAFLLRLLNRRRPAEDA